METDYMPYEGNQPYIFVCYSHRDRGQVIPLLNALRIAGYRIWYDRGIQAGKDWLSELANHITQCEVFMPLHTAASVQSDFCYKEIHFALGKKRKIVPIYLENVELGDELRLLLTSIQHRRISDYGGVDGFVGYLAYEPYFASCRDESLSESDEPDESLPNPTSSQSESDTLQTLDWHKDGGICWAYSDGTLYIRRKPGANGQMPNYEWSESDSYSTSPWKEFRKLITRIEIEQGVTRIGNLAFYHYEELTCVTIPNSVTRIGEWAFEDCKGLTQVTIPDGVTRIDWRAFNGCTRLTSVTIPSSVKEIGAEAFFGCKELNSVIIPDCVTKISWRIFSGCINLSSVILPNKITEIGEEAFFGCKRLKNVTIPNGVTEIGHLAFLGCKELTSVTIPDSTIRIGIWAFLGCPKLNRVEIPTRTRIFRLFLASFPLRTRIIRRLTQ